MVADVAGPPSPLAAVEPVPVNVVIMFVDSDTFRILLLFLSAIYRYELPQSMITLIGKFSIAEVAALPSPKNPAVPVPATVVMTFEL